MMVIWKPVGSVTSKERPPHSLSLGSASSLRPFCLARVAYYKAPGYVSFCPSLPLTPTEKIQRGLLRELGHRLLDDRACVDTRAMKKRSSA